MRCLFLAEPFADICCLKPSSGCGKQPISIGAGVRYYADSPSTGANGWGARLIVTLLFPD